MQKQPTNLPAQPPRLNEQILVIKRELLIPDESWYGIKQDDIAPYLQTIQKHQQFMPRYQAEENTAYKQVIPYLVFEYNNTYFLMQRRSQASEKRLQNKFSLGIGGHIRQEDICSNSLFDWARREFNEEIEYNGSFEIEPLGILNDDTTEVGKVHIGLVLLLHGNSDNIQIKSELKSGVLVSLEQCQQQYNDMESWTQIVVDYLLRK